MCRNCLKPNIEIKGIRVVHIAECAGGVERYLQMLLPRLEQQGLWQHLICSFQYNKDKFIGEIDGVEQMNIEQTFSPIRVVQKVIGIRKSIKRIKPDIVYCHSSFAGGLGRLAAIGTKCKIVYNPHGWAFNRR